MSRTLADCFRREFERFRSLAVDKWAISPAHLMAVEHLLKPIHKRYLSLACAATVAGHKSSRNDYAEGIVEVGYLYMILAVKGLENPACVLLRQSIELCLKHVFFLSHPVEYGWARSRIDYRDLTFQALIDYVRRTDEYQTLRDGGRACKEIDYWYSVLSRYIHVHSKGFMSYSAPGAGYFESRTYLKKVEQRTKGLWPNLILLLTAFHADRFGKASLIEQRLIKHALPSQHRSLF